MVSTREQAKGWWFNREDITLIPDAGNGHIMLPADTLSINPADDALPYVQRGRRLFNSSPRPGADGYVFTDKVACVLVRYLEFEDLPALMQNLVSVGTVLDFQSGYDADTVKQRKSDNDYQRAWLSISAEETRNRGANLLARTGVATAFAMLSPRRFR